MSIWCIRDDNEMGMRCGEASDEKWIKMVSLQVKNDSNVPIHYRKQVRYNTFTHYETQMVTTHKICASNLVEKTQKKVLFGLKNEGGNGKGVHNLFKQGTFP